MSRFLNTFCAILLVVLFSDSVVFSSEIEESKDKTITGVLVRVDVKNQAIYIKENSRIVKFKTTSDFCARFKDKINLEVDVTYKVGNNKSLQIVTMAIAVKEEGLSQSNINPKASVKGKQIK